MKTSTKMLATAAAGAAGYYLYASAGAKKNRKIAAKWAGDFKDDVVSRGKKLRAMDKKAMVGIVDGVAKVYHGARGLNKKEVLKAAGELKGNWDKLTAEFTKKKKTSK